MKQTSHATVSDKKRSTLPLSSWTGHVDSTLTQLLEKGGREEVKGLPTAADVQY